METPKVYVICDQNCKFEGMTKEQILTAIAQAVETGEIGDINTGFVQTIKTVNGVGLKFFVGTQNAYDALSDSDKENLFALITDDTSSAELLEYLNGLSDRVTVLENKAAASHATTADRATYATSAGTADEATSAKKATTATTADKITEVTAIGSNPDSTFRHVWFSDSKSYDTGKPWGDDNFKYNPKTNTLAVKYIDGKLTSAAGHVDVRTMTEFVNGKNQTGITIPTGRSVDDIAFITISCDGDMFLGVQQYGTEIMTYRFMGVENSYYILRFAAQLYTYTENSLQKLGFNVGAKSVSLTSGDEIRYEDGEIILVGDVYIAVYFR